jgi:hypothetical protein
MSPKGLFGLRLIQSTFYKLLVFLMIHRDRFTINGRLQAS